MIDLIKLLLKTPGSESEPEPWATRFVAHGGLGVLMVVVGIWVADGASLWALGLTLLVYALIELLEWVINPGRRNWRFLLDCVLDWTGVASLAGTVAATWEQNLTLMLSLSVCVVLIMTAGVLKRAK